MELPDSFCFNFFVTLKKSMIFALMNPKEGTEKSIILLTVLHSFRILKSFAMTNILPSDTAESVFHPKAFRLFL